MVEACLTLELEAGLAFSEAASWSSAAFSAAAAAAATQVYLKKHVSTMCYRLVMGGFRSISLESVMVAFKIHRKPFIYLQMDWTVEFALKANS